MKVDMVIATYNRADQLRETMKNVLAHESKLGRIYVINNNSTDHTKDVLEEFERGKITVIHNERNLGAAGGKNVGLRSSDADVIIVLDDDAIFCSQDPVDVVMREFEGDPTLGLIQFKIINYATKRILKYEFPGDDPEKRGDDSFYIGYYIGAGHAIRKSMLEDVGYYPSDFGLYAHEEVDLSYRAVNGGYVLRYVPAVAVFHKKSPGGRLAPREALYNMFLNRLVMTHRYLPFPYSVINSLLWFAKTVIDSRSPGLAIRAYFDYLKKRPGIRRDILRRDAITYMRKNRGRLFR